MSNLHEVVYQIVLNPQLLTHVDSQSFREKFNLSAGEVQALAVLPSDQMTWQHFLLPETLKSATRSLVECLWVPPNLP